MSRLLVLVSLLTAAAVQAADPYVPEPLRDWQQWVLEGKEYRDCPFFLNRPAAAPGDFICAWPGLLSVDVDTDGARFSQRWTVIAAEQWLPLPGDTAYWPHQVSANGRPISVVLRDGEPSVLLPPGNYRLSGSFSWDERPGVLRVPDSSGLVSLTLNGQPVTRPDRNRRGIFLGERKAESQARDAVTTTVYRLVSDNVPTWLTTQLQIDVAGSVREELFAPVLPEGYTPLLINSQLPARLEPDGSLRVQVRPGRWQIDLIARAGEVVNAVSMPQPQANLPETEIWSYQSTDRLRVTAPGGLPPVDPQQVQVPGQWQGFPAFRIAAGETLTIEERSRGRLAADNDLRLRRTLWLDFDGSGFIVSDHIEGQMRSDWRLDMRPPFTLLSASVDAQPLLVTEGDDDGETGVELRGARVDLETVGRSEAGSTMPVSGWDARFQGQASRLNLPPGYKLLAAPGADRANYSWVSQWQLLDFFLLLIVTIGAWRLFGRAAGIVALLAMVLSYHELNAPVWLWLNLLIAIALLRVAPAGRLRQSVRMYQGLSVLALLVVLLPFIASQLRIAIYPQLEPQFDGWRVAQEMDAFDARAPEAPARNMPDRESSAGLAAGRDQVRMAQKSVAVADAVEEIVVSGYSAASPYSYARYAPNALVQAGPGVPSWQWNSYALSWNGPVDADQVLRLFILPRWLVSLLRFVEVALLLLFTAYIAAEIVGRRFELPGGLGIGRGTPAVALLLAAALLATPDVRADTPDPALLKELEQRLTQPPECVPRCAEIVAANVAIDTARVRMTLAVHALADVAVPLPGSEQGWRPGAILVDGVAASQVRLSPDGALWLRLDAGRHTVTLDGPIAAVDSLEIPFPEPPRVIEAASEAWFVAGIKDRRLLSGSLQLTRQQADDDGEGTVRWESSRFPPFVRVERSVRMDLDWSVLTTVTRIAPAQGALTLELPLLDGETVVEENFTVGDGSILVSMAPNQSSVSWRSNLARNTPLTLSAAAGSPWQEVWQVGVGSIWHAEFSGVPESDPAAAGESQRLAHFYPRGGESLRIDATRPDASEGATLAFDAVSLYVQHGKRSADATLSLEYRSTSGSQHQLQLPQGAEITAVTIDGRSEPLRDDAGVLTVPILPGAHDIDISWQLSESVSRRTATPPIDIGAPASNISLQLNLPADRWLLATGGPALGPAVLYWSELAVLVLLALLLGRIDLTPLRTRHWLLLGLGFSTFSWPVYAVVIVWLLICGARRRWPLDLSWWRFNLLQVGLALLTVVALAAIVASLPQGLLGSPDMSVAGNDSAGNSLRWFADRSASVLPVATAWSLPLWVYKTLILAWALWLSFALLRWLPWVWQCFSSNGYWQSREPAATAGPGKPGQ